MELWGSFDRSAEPLSGLFFMLKDLTAPVRCNLHSLHLQHLSVEGRAQGEHLDLWGAQRIGLSEVRSYGGQRGEPEDQGLSPPPPPVRYGAIAGVSHQTPSKSQVPSEQ